MSRKVPAQTQKDEKMNFRISSMGFSIERFFHLIRDLSIDGRADGGAIRVGGFVLERANHREVGRVLALQLGFDPQDFIAKQIISFA